MTRARLLLRSLVVIPLALFGALTLVDHGWTLWNEVRMTDAMERAADRLAEADARDASVIVADELANAGVPARYPDISAQNSDGTLLVEVRVPWNGLFAAVPHRSELRRTLTVQVDRT